MTTRKVSFSLDSVEDELLYHLMFVEHSKNTRAKKIRTMLRTALVLETNDLASILRGIADTKKPEEEKVIPTPVEPVGHGLGDEAETFSDDEVGFNPHSYFKNIEALEKVNG